MTGCATGELYDLPFDFDGDRMVSLADFAIFAETWLDVIASILIKRSMRHEETFPAFDECTRKPGFESVCKPQT